MSDGDSKSNGKMTLPAGNLGDTFLAMLESRGVDYLFANAGTDFASITEGLAKAKSLGRRAPKPITAPHENAAIGMAYGYTLMTGKPQAVMVHVNVGTANSIAGLINASRENIPMILAAGRNPVSESGHFGTRNWSIHWPQEVFDQASMVREYVKWEYQFSTEADMETMIDRALQVADSDPKGPVYITLPREALGREISEKEHSATTRLPAALPTAPNPGAIFELAGWIKSAKRPLIITNTIGKVAEAVAALESLAGKFALPVIQHNARYMNISASHEMNLGFGGQSLVENADLIVLVECDVPWVPLQFEPKSDCRIAHIAADPIYARYPMRGFKSDLTIQGSATLSLGALETALEGAGIADADIASRRTRLKAEHDDLWTEYDKESDLQTGPGGDLNPAWVSREIFRACGADATYISEYPMRAHWLPTNRPKSFFSTPPAGALGWGLGAALGIKLALGDGMVVAGVGDGAYMFNNPVVMHQISAAYDLPILIIVFNNRRWNAVRGSTLQMYPDGEASKLNDGVPLSALTPSPDFELFPQSVGGFGARVETPEQFGPALAQALDAVKNEGRQALLNVMTT
jgi:acetolactate synthase-1/2/3 large subunit